MRFVVLLCFPFVSLFAQSYTLELYEKIFTSFFHKERIAVYATNVTKTLLKKSRLFVVVNRCDVADVVMVDDDKVTPPCQAIPLFATSRRAYRRFKEAFGAFYWVKGRVQIHFRKKNLQKYGLSLSYELERFADEK